MLEANINLPQEQRIELRNWGSFTDWSCNCPPGFFNEIENIDIQDDGSLCVRPGSSTLCPDNPLTSQGNFRIERLACFKDKLFIFQEKKVTCKNDDGTIETVAGPKGDELLFEAIEDSCSDHDTWNEHMIITDDACSQPVKIYCNELGQLTAKAMGLPPVNVCPDLSSSVNTGTANYIYAFFWCCEYTIASGKQFQDVGPVKLVRIENAPSFVNPGEFVDITNIPELVCPPGFQYNLNNTRLHIYRTTDNGTTFFEVAQIPTTQISYQDGLQDNVLQNNQVIYNQGSTVQWTAAPAASFVEVIDDVAWYAGKTCVDGQVFENRVYQSIPGAVGSSPREFYVEFEGRINGLSQYARFPIVSVVDDCGHCQLYRINDRLDIFGRGNLTPYVIADATAAINNNSFVKAETGLYFLGYGGSGIYRTDGYKVQKVTDPKCNFDETYCRMIKTERQRKNVYGTYDKKRNRIYWAVSTIPGLTENNKLLVYHEHHNAFTWHSNGDCFRPSAIIFDQISNNLIRGDSRGYTFEHNPLDLTDPDINVDIAVDQWGTKHIPWCLKTTPFDFGDCVSNKQVNRIYFRGKPQTNATFQVESFDNGCQRPSTCNLVEFKNTEGWCVDDEYAFCEAPEGWCVGTECHMYASRRFKCTRTMTKDKAIRLCATESVLECGTMPSGFISWNKSFGSFTKPSGMEFTNDDIGRTIEFEGVSATIILVQNGVAATDLPVGERPDSGGYAWALRGYAKNERFCLDCMGFFYCVLGTVGGEFSVAESKTLSWETGA